MGTPFRNPVWPGYFADPFILRWQGAYYAYGTGETAGNVADGRPVFPLLSSTDLVHWTDLGGVLVARAGDGPRAYWAPEVAERNGVFYLYYSSAPAGRDEDHRLRVATSPHPTGPFTPKGCVLPESEGFGIDAHPFRDPQDGKWYLYFAKDYFDDRVGTGLAVVPLTPDLLRAAAPSRPVLRAQHDWQIYERNRTVYGREWPAWHTVEGPFVVHYGGRYWCFYSGGNWQTRDYGVSYGVSDHPLGPWQHGPGADARILRERPGEVLGPGHNSLVLAPNGRTHLIVYHAWDTAATARRMCLDPLTWSPEGPHCSGPSTGPQFIPTA